MKAWRELEAHELRHAGKAGLPRVMDLSEASERNPLAWARARGNEVRERLPRDGAVLLRGATVADAGVFEELLAALGFSLEDHYVIGLTPRQRRGPHVFTSTEAPPAFHVLQHTEMCYQPVRPGIVAFYCEVEPGEFGETPLFDTRGALSAVSPGLRRHLETRRVRYSRHFHARKTPRNYEKTWAESFATESRDEVESICRALDTRFEWLPDGSLRTETDVPAIVCHPETGELALGINVFHPAAFRWELGKFRARHGWLGSFLLGRFVERQFRRPEVFMKLGWDDGTPFSARDAREIAQAYWSHATAFAWKQGDVLLLDNIVTGHGRLNVVPPRRILAALGNRIDVRHLQTLPPSV